MNNEYREMLDLESTITQADTLTDHTNASLVVKWFGDKIRYLKDREVFLVWNGKFWEKDKNRLNDFYIQAMKRAQVEALKLPSNSEEERKRKKDVIAHFISSENTLRMKNSIAQLPIFSELVCLHEEFNAVPNIITVNNGTVNLDTGELMPFDPKNLCTRFVPVDYRKDVKSDLWDNFIRDTFSEDAETINYVQSVIGSVLFQDAIQESIILLIGPGGHGKGTFVYGIDSVLGGKHGVSTHMDHRTFLSNQHSSGSAPSPDIAKLADKLIAWVSELPQGVKLDEAKLKNLTGGDKITARFLSENPFEFVCRSVLIMSSNYEPMFDGNDSGLLRRMKKIAFRHAPKNPDATLKITLASNPDHQSAILNWIVEGAMNYRKNGIVVPQNVQMWSKELFEKNSPVKMAVDDYLVYDPQLPASSSITVSAFRKRLDSVLKENGLRGMSRREVKENLEAMGVMIRSSHKQDVMVGYKVCPEISRAEFEELNGGESIFAVA